MSMGSQADDSGEMNEINMTPLIDVMLVLLIIFIITLPVVTNSVPVDLPQTNSPPSTTKPVIITLSVDKEGKIFWNESLIDSTQLVQRFAASAQINPQPEIHIRGDKEVEYEHMIKIMASAQNAGLTKLGFITEQE